MEKGDLEQIRSWAIDRAVRTLEEIGMQKERILKLEDEIKKERLLKKKKVLKDVLFTLNSNQSQYIEKLAYYKVVAKKAKGYLDLIFPELPTLG